MITNRSSYSSHTHAPQSGVSLLQLAIMMTIIGLLAGGIVAGLDLKKASERNKIITEVEGYKRAAQGFQAKYNALPGDMKNATTYWGDCSCGPSSSGSFGSTATRNGNGNGHVDGLYNEGIDGYCTGTTAMDTFGDDEPYYFWKHLANAGLIAGTFTGTLPDLTTSSRVQIMGQNIPSSSLNPKWGYSIAYLCLSGNNGTYFYNKFCGNVIAFGTAQSPAMHNSENISAYRAISTLEAKLIDQKIDDGKPGMGQVTTLYPDPYSLDSSACANGTNYLTSTYNTALSGIQCSLFFDAGF